jgi:plastocyanin
LQLFPALLVCLTVCFFLVAAPIDTQLDIRTANLTRANLLSSWTAPNPGADPGQPHSLFVPSVVTLAAINTSALPDSSGVLTGKVTFEGTPKKYKPIDMSAEPNCAKFYPSAPMPEVSVTGPDNALQNVIVYISEGAPDEHSSGPVVQLSQRGCRYFPHIVAAQTGQEVWVKNDDSVTHSIHPMAHVNSEWNRSQPPGTPPVVIRYDQPEFIKVKCELHPWMRGVLAVFKNSHHAVTDSNGSFSLPNLPPGKYTVTAWHELYGTQSKEITVTAGKSQDLNFVFKVTPY